MIIGIYKDIALISFGMSFMVLLDDKKYSLIAALLWSVFNAVFWLPVLILSTLFPHK